MPRINVRNKGSGWERELADLLNKKINSSTWKRIPGSGALGTILEMGSLTADVVGKIPFTEKEFKVEAKVGYGGAKQMTVQKEWFDKVKMQAEQTFSIPIVACKFSGAREGIKVFIALDLDTFCNLMNYTTDLYEELKEKIEKENKHD